MTGDPSSHGSPGDGSRGFSRRLGLLMVSILVVLACSEAVLWLLGQDHDPSSSWHYHPDLGWVQEPGRRHRHVVAGEEVQVTYNSMGFRDAEHTFDKPAGVKRAIILGDEFTAAVDVNMEETFSSILGRILTQRSVERWEIINLGVEDFGSAQELIALERLGFAYQPDVVIHQILPFNDICNNSIQLAGLCRSRNDAYRPYFVETTAGLSMTSAQPLRNLVRRNLATYRFGEVVHRRYFAKEETPIDHERYQEIVAGAGFPRLSPLFHTYLPDGEQAEPIAQGWRVTELIIERMAWLCREQEIAYVPVVIPAGSHDWIRRATKYSRKMTRDYPEGRLGELFGHLDVRGVLMRDVLDGDAEYFLSVGRRGARAYMHLLTAESVYHSLLENGIVVESSAKVARSGRDPAIDMTRSWLAYEYRWGTAIRFGQGGNAGRYQKDGWGEAEQEATSMMAAGTLLLYVREPREGVLLKMSLRRRDNRRHDLRILINDKQAGEVDVPATDFQERSILIDPALFARQGLFVVKFALPETTSAADTGIARIALRSLSLVEVAKASFIAEPNPIRVCDGTGLGATTLSWSSTGTQRVEVRVGAPDGSLVSRRVGEGEVATKKWVRDGSVFYLQDVSDEGALTAENTLARLEVGVTDAGCP